MPNIFDEVYRMNKTATPVVKDLNRFATPFIGEIARMNRVATPVVKDLNRLATPFIGEIARMNRVATPVVKDLNRFATPFIGEIARMNRVATLVVKDLNRFATPFIDEIARMNRVATPVVKDLNRLAAPFNGEIARMNRVGIPFGQHLQKAQRAFIEIGNWIPQTFTVKLLEVALWVQWDAKLELIRKETGWLPFPGAELYLADVGDDMSLAARRYEDFVDGEFPRIRQQMEEKLEECTVDEETRAAFNEGLNAHEKGYYRSVCVLLLVEIERVLRMKLNKQYGGSLDQKDFRDYTDEKVELHDVLSGNIYGSRLLDYLVSLYNQAHTEEVCKKLEATSILNRHAGLHGLAVYKSKKDSFNILVLSTFFFRAVSQV